MKAATILAFLALATIVFGDCSVTLTPVARVGSTWPVNNGAGIAGIYDIVVYNNGNQPATRVYFDIKLPNNVDIIQWWQFTRLPPTFEDLPNLTPGSSYSSAGFIVEKQYASSLPSVTLKYNLTVCA